MFKHFITFAALKIGEIKLINKTFLSLRYGYGIAGFLCF